MARTELPNGVILPAEYSDDWYEDMTSNLTRLDDVIGSDSEKLNADGVYFLRMSSAALTDSGTGNFSDLNSSYKIKTGDLVLDSGRKLYRIVSVDSTNETFSVGNSLFKVTAESDLAPVAESGDYDDLDNKPDLKPVATSGDYDDLTDLPTYGITRLCSSAITDNSTVAFSAISSTDKIKVGDFLLDTNGKLYQISSVDTANETVSVTTPLTQLALDANVMHLTGNETCTGNKGFVDNIIVKKIVSNAAQLQINARSNADSVAVIAGDSATEGGGIWLYGKNSANNSHVALQVYDTNNSTFHAVRLNMDGALTPTVSNNGLGSSSYKWVSLNGINPGSLSMPDLSNGLDISGYITDLTGASNINKFTPTVSGWISIGLSSADFIELYIPSSLIGGTFTKSSINNYAQAFMPVIANKEVRFALKGSSIGWAKFYPCLGNV